MLSEVDEACEQLIVDGIHAERPGDGILSEEGAEAESETGVRWVIDPIDGTTNYLYGHPGYAISIAVERDGEAVAGVVHDPLHGERFSATRGDGARRNGEPIRVSDETDPSTALVATGFGYTPEGRTKQAEALAGLIGSIRDIRRMGAAAVDLCSVACGRVDAFFERGLNHWDLAAGELIAREAGAVVSAIEGGPARAGSVLGGAAGPARPAARAARPGRRLGDPALESRPDHQRPDGEYNHEQSDDRDHALALRPDHHVEYLLGAREQVPGVESKHPPENDPDCRDAMQGELNPERHGAGDARGPHVGAEAQDRECVGAEARGSEGRVQREHRGRRHPAALGGAEVGW